MSDRPSRGTVTLEIELSEPMYEMMREKIDDKAPLSRTEPKSVAEWVKESAAIRLGELQDEVPVTADIPGEVVQRAKRYAEDARIRGDEEARFEDYVHDFIALQFKYPAEGIQYPDDEDAEE
jgi:hypothetical protein